MEDHEDDPDDINWFHMYLNDVNVHILYTVGPVL